VAYNGLKFQIKLLLIKTIYIYFKYIIIKSDFLTIDD
jgi:hypothetical protein